MRMACGVEYDGSGFRGWQRQGEGVRTVQGCLERALAAVADHPVATRCAGRTDAGVHGLAQVVHFDTGAQRSAYAWIMGANSNLPADVNVLWAQPVPDHFDARFSARSRRYRYVILNRPYRSALYRQRATWHYLPLEVERMRAASQWLIGEHDFSSFRAAGCQSKSPNRNVLSLMVERQGDWVVLEVEANAFLHNMVRIIAGVLMAVGDGRQAVEWVREVLEARDRTVAAVTAPAEGLYLVAVQYAEEFDLPGAHKWDQVLQSHMRDCKT